MTPDLASLTLTLALRQLADGAYSILDLVEACFRRLQSLDPAIHAFITPAPELAVRQAIQLIGMPSHPSAALTDLRLPGLPLAVKDLFDVAGLPTTAGSRFFSDVIPDRSAAAVDLLTSSGAIVIGKTNTHEIALGVTGVNPHFGAVANPWDLSCISGGSSSGSAAALASGMCLGALGTDTGGSIRIPAALCGVVGLKPTYGRVSTRGVLPLSWNLDHVGPLARDVRDVALLLSVLAGYDPLDPASVDQPVPDYLSRLEQGLRGLRLVRAVGAYVENAASEVLSAFDQAVQVFVDLGASLENVDLSWLHDLALANGRMTVADAAAFHRDRLASHPDWFGADVAERLRQGAAVTSTEYSLARRTQVEARRRFTDFFAGADILLLPTVPIPAPPIAESAAVQAAALLTRFTAPFDLTGLPALSLPCGFSQAGLPLGLQLVARSWDEATLLQAAYAYEQATPWHLRRPVLDLGT